MTITLAQAVRIAKLAANVKINAIADAAKPKNATVAATVVVNKNNRFLRNSAFLARKDYFLFNNRIKLI